jgi:hypothetical protein
MSINLTTVYIDARQDRIITGGQLVSRTRAQCLVSDSHARQSTNGRNHNCDCVPPPRRAGGPTAAPAFFFPGQHPSVVQKCMTLGRHSCATPTNSRNHNSDRACRHGHSGTLPFPHLGNTPASCRSTQCWVGTCVPHTPAAAIAIVITRGHSTTPGHQLRPPLLPVPQPGALALHTSTRHHFDSSHARPATNGRDCTRLP